MTDATYIFSAGLLAGFIFGSGVTLALLAAARIWPFHQRRTP